MTLCNLDVDFPRGESELIRTVPKPRKSEVTQRAILDTAEEFLRDHPFSDLSVVKLMGLVGCSRPVFYQYFADLFDLMAVLLNDFTEEVMKLAEETTWFGDSVPQDTAAEMALMQQQVYEIAYRRAVIFRASQEAAAYSEELRQLWKQIMDAYDELVSASIKRDQDAGLIGEMDAVLVAKSLNRMNVGNMVLHFGGRPRTQVKRLMPGVIHIWVSSLYGEDAARRVA